MCGDKHTLHRQRAKVNRALVCVKERRREGVAHIKQGSQASRGRGGEALQRSPGRPASRPVACPRPAARPPQTTARGPSSPPPTKPPPRATPSTCPPS